MSAAQAPARGLDRLVPQAVNALVLDAVPTRLAGEPATLLDPAAACPVGVFPAREVEA